MTGRVVTKWNREWKFAEGNYAGAEQEGFTDSGWRQVDVPHDWSIEKPFDPHMPHGGFQACLPRWTVGWYRKRFFLEASSGPPRVYVQFDGVHHNSEVWINGHSVGKRPYGYVSFQYDLTPYIRWDAENVLAVKVDNTPIPSDRWYSGSGIYRNVWLIRTNPIHVAEWGTFITTPRITPEAAIVNAATTVVSHSEHDVECRIVTEVFDEDGKRATSMETREVLKAHETKEIRQEGEISNPELWSPELPVLYQARTTIIYDGKAHDSFSTTFGIREIRLDACSGLFLNGKRLKLKGVCLHHDLGCLGAAYQDTAMKRRLETLKEMGCNAIRFAHNPMAPELLDLCDRMGFLVIDEIFDKWKSLYYEHLFDEWWHKDLASALIRDRNHPCVFLWSVGNEVENQGQASMLAILDKLVAACHELDPTRPVTCGLEPHNFPIRLREGSIEEKVEHTKELARHVDILGLNYQEQWYEAYREAMPDTLIVGTETFPYYRGQGNRVKGYVPVNPWFDVVRHDYVIGQFVWAGIDYLGESVYPSKGWSSGLIDTCGFRKPVSYLQQSLWSDQPVVQIAVFDDAGKQEFNPQWTMHWKAPAMVDHWTLPEYAGKLLRLVTFTNCETVELVLNGESYGVRELAHFPDHLMIWHLPYNPGEIKAIGRNGGRIACEHSLATAGAACGIMLRADRQTLPADGQEIAHIEVTIVDAKGNRVPNPNVEVTVEAIGAGRMIGIDNGDLTSDESYKGNRRRTRNGKCLVIVQSGQQHGELVLKASAEGLPEEEVRWIVE
ncbi:glycoside hydrolase family 2 TIM barrel-domain containing protein [Gorillibacterium timonense]|uniref:glycoside hydrolase family 2 TIM barrel-domain containing protein n=1 Tax=Gorillibacterium timonense TaxID=1689269 RepID=UPI00071D4E86|nr:glycoside hydrolase family 2 TIM barrel-domain containing protein [Gorillibacterium timonense]